MSTCKKNVLEIIDEAFGANHLGNHCTCIYPEIPDGLCNYCKIEGALTTARACIVVSVNQVAILKSNMAAKQMEIETKIRDLLDKSYLW